MSGGLRHTKNFRDANHEQIAKRYEQHMCMVLDLSAVGRGCPDMLVRLPTRQGGILAFVEVKTEAGVLSPAQERFRRVWGSSAWVIRSIDDVDVHVLTVKKQFK